MKYHFNITTVHKYRFFVFCLYSSCVYLCTVVMWKWYFILLPKPSCSCAFSVLIYIPTYSFIFKNIFYYSCILMAGSLLVQVVMLQSFSNPYTYIVIYLDCHLSRTLYIFNVAPFYYICIQTSQLSRI